MKHILLALFVVLTVSCKNEKKQLSAEDIINKTIENAGGNKYDNSKIEFTFRDVEYVSERKSGNYRLSRKTKDSLGIVEDVLDNKGFYRFHNGDKVNLHDSLATNYSNSVNSVHYFLQLPYGLNSEAVNKELIGETTVKGKEYYKIKITFDSNGGGTDHDDEYLYWINKTDYTVDYFAYKYYSGKGGIRFRVAYNPRVIGGLRFVDYKNYKIDPWKEVTLKDLDQLYDKGKLKLLSEIKTENIVVTKN